MPRRGFIPKREVLPDPVYGTVVVTKLINQLMYDGKRGTAQRVCYEAFEMVAEKTGKEAKILINPHARRDINRLLAGRSGDEYILQSKQRGPDHKPRPITRQRAYQIINEIARKAGIKDHIGCHTLRKTFGYHYYKMTQDVVSLQRILCHSSRRETLIYIGVIQEEIDESLMKFNLTRRR